MYLIQAVVYEHDEDGEISEPQTVEQEVIVLCDDKDQIDKCKNSAEAEIKGVDADEINVYNLAEADALDEMVGVVSVGKPFIAELDSVAAAEEEE